MPRTWPLFAPLSLSVAAATMAPAASTPPVQLAVPVDCAIGGQCLIQKLFDHDPGPARLDHRCGVLTTDGHDGIDFRLRTMADMAGGVAVLAAAGGTVLRVRDGEPDISVKTRKDLNGRDAGNGVVIDHGQGWVTQYSHLRQGSVRVKPGDRVRAGDRIGLIGMSGNAEFPHLHFAVRFQDRKLDPFSDPVRPGACKPTGPIAGSLWSPRAAQALPYQPTALIATDLARAVPPASVADRPQPARPSGRSDPLIIWADLFGTRTGDMQRFRLIGPDKAVLLDQSKALDQGHLSWFAYAGRRPPADGWPPGRYVAQYELTRGGTIVARGTTEVTLR